MGVCGRAGGAGSTGIGHCSCRRPTSSVTVANRVRSSAVRPSSLAWASIASRWPGTTVHCAGAGVSQPGDKGSSSPAASANAPSIPSAAP